METRVDEIADRIYRLSTFVPDIGPTGFTFNQFLIDADEPALFHTGPRAMFPVVSEAITSLMPLDRLRWIMFGHLESDECGAMNLFLQVAPERPGRTHRDRLHGLHQRPRRPTAGAHRCLTVPLTSAVGESVASTRHMFPTGGTPMCSMRRPPAPSSVVTS